MKRDKRKISNEIRNGDKRIKFDLNENGKSTGYLDADSGQRTAFPTEKTSQQIEHVPLNPMDYISLVRREAASCPPFVWSSESKIAVPSGRNALKPYEEESMSKSPRAMKTSTKLQHCNETHMVHPPYIIDEDWHVAFIENFCHIKEYALSMKVNGKCEDPGMIIPDTMAGWRVFMLDDSHSPSLKLVRSLSLGTTITLLGYYAKWLCPKISDSLTQWIYSLLVCLPVVLEGRDVAVLREIAKKSIKLRTNPSKLVDTVTCYILDVIISVVAGYYRQSDLAIIQKRNS